jgi:hypothetical protein
MKIQSLLRAVAIVTAVAIVAITGALPASAQTAPYTRTVIVPANGTAAANGAALLAAIAGLSPAPSFAVRWLIKLEPGVYNVGTTPVVLSQYVDIEGSGVVQSILQGTVQPPPGFLIGGLVQGASNSELRNLTVSCVSDAITPACQAISYNVANGRLSQVRILLQGTGTGSHWGIRTFDSSPILDDVEINVSTGGANNYGIVYGGTSTLNIARSNITVFGATVDNLGLVLRNTPTWSLMRDSSVTAYGGGRAYAVAYLSAGASAALSFDNVILSSHSASIENAGIGIHPGGPSFVTSPIFFRAGRIYSTGTGMEALNASFTVSNTDIESYGIAVGGTTINVMLTKFTGTGLTYGASSATCAANVNAAATFLPSTCP